MAAVVLYTVSCGCNITAHALHAQTRQQGVALARLYTHKATVTRAAGHPYHCAPGSQEGDRGRQS